jgi:hypothetical protein
VVWALKPDEHHRDQPMDKSRTLYADQVSGPQRSVRPNASLGSIIVMRTGRDPGAVAAQDHDGSQVVFALSYLYPAAPFRASLLVFIVSRHLPSL